MLLDANGNRIDRAAVPTQPVVDPDPLLLVTQDLFTKRPFDIYDGTPQSLARISTRLFVKAGHTVRTSALNNIYDLASVTAIAPAVGPIAGGTVVTITGKYLDGSHGVTFGGTPGTAFSVTPDGTSITVTAPAHAAGAVAVVVSDDSGNVTVASGFTFQ